MPDFRLNIWTYIKFKWSKYIQPKGRDWQSVKKYDPTVCCVHKNHFKYNDIGRLKEKGWSRYIMRNLIKQKKAGVSIFISDKVESKAETIIQRQRNII